MNLLLRIAALSILSFPIAIAMRQDAERSRAAQLEASGNLSSSEFAVLKASVKVIVRRPGKHLSLNRD